MFIKELWCRVFHQKHARRTHMSSWTTDPYHFWVWECEKCGCWYHESVDPSRPDLFLPEYKMPHHKDV